MTTAETTPRLPAPPAIAETLRALGCPAFGFAAQHHLSALAATTQSDGSRIVGVSLSYTYYRHPQYRNHPANFVDLTPEQTRAIERAEASSLPEAVIEQITSIRYPTLWDAVRTSKVVPGDARNALEVRLTAHANDVLRASVPMHVPLRAPRATTSGRVSSAELLETTCLMVDGVAYRGRVLDAGAHLVAVGARIESRFLTVVYDRRIAPRITMEFTAHRP